MNLYITDLDGTLLDDSSRVSGRSAEIISRLTAEGALISVATARTPATVEQLLCDTDISVPVVVMTGAALWDRRHKRYVTPHFISPEAVREAIGVFDRHGLEPFVYTIRDEFLVVYHHGPMTAEERQFVDLRKDLELKRFLLESAKADVREASDVILLFGMGDRDRLSAIADDLQRAGDYSISFYEDNASPLYYIEVFAPGVSKAAAVTELAAMTDADHLTVYGDNLNDLSMMAVADDAVAVANAKPEVIAKASRVIGRNSDDAVALDILRNERS